MTGLHRRDFAAFYAHVHATPGSDPREPFPWQEDLLDHVLAGEWPELIDVPTGLGKTSVLDIAIFAAALNRDSVPRRCFFVVDRRLIVDEAYRHASRIRDVLADASADSVAGKVAAALLVEHDEEPLEVTRMRGGVTWSWRWLERPDRQAIVVGTVDQIGSRFLFRGYGVGDQLRPIDAALVGTDSLIIVDEAHLSRPFLTTLSDAMAQDTTPPEVKPVVVTMTASPTAQGPRVHRISNADQDHPVAGKRLRASKTAHLVEVTGVTKKNNDQQVVAALAQWADHLSHTNPVIGVISNTVARARAVFEHLHGTYPGRCMLLTGRIRPVDRDYLLLEWYDRIKADRPCDPEEPVFVVATQTVEVGANIDFTALVTESASLPPLIQRFGRLNRLGSAPAAPAVIVHSALDSEGVYGEARQATWQWLSTLQTPAAFRPGTHPPSLPEEGLDVSPAALRRLTAAVFEQDRKTWKQLQGTEPYTPYLSPAHLNAWTRTSPIPSPNDPSPAPFLHGLQREVPNVSLAWRELAGDEQAWRHALEVLPLMAEESIEVPLLAVRQWLSGQQITTRFADVEGEPSPDEPPRTAASPGEGAPRPVARYSSRESIEVIGGDAIRPGDRIVVPASYGGCDAFGWNPTYRHAVRDIGDLCGGNGKRRASVRLGPTLTTAITAHDPSLASALKELVQSVERDRQAEQLNAGAYCRQIEQILRTRPDIIEVLGTGLDHDGDDVPPHLAVLRRLALAKKPKVDEHLASGTVVLTSDITSYGEDDSAQSSSTARTPMRLDDHQRTVQKRAEEFARNLRLPAPLVQAVGLAALWHDEGKRDERFQAMLHGGDRWAAAAAEAEDPPRILAKSGMNPLDRQLFRAAQQRAGYPAGMRHEALSAQIANALLDNTTAINRDLVVHLIAAHHGYNRPLLKPVTDPAPVTSIQRHGQKIEVDSARSIDWSAPQRLTTLTSRYGRWGLARLEAIVRLADIWCSAREEADA
ncbi:type I-U CRISPR-associated helicase/endonuclease Cas3 [Sphaerisporangium sp. NPDC005288]|uniref:type I-G CRISPR-associated helicase/endonuclease Cas3g n=1 Tax=Sphaerisporangium sp. NPDC005288 TaxID=3155114 RepID=UPI0033BB6EFC